MKIYIVLLVLLRTFTQSLVDTYTEDSSLCRHLLQKAIAEDIPSVKSAYFLTVMEEDQQAFFHTLEKYQLGFLASNITYASEEEIEKQACTMPHYVTDALEWTAGITPLVIIWVVYTILSWLRQKCTKKIVYKTPLKKVKKTLDKPPRAPRKPARTEHMNYIKSNKPVKSNVEIKESFAGKVLQGISPSLRKRMMPTDV
ncbi:MAG: hypothetical protein CMM25_03985 [Rhodospirillaceae bacterium]|nr:hypothetical protein [Rhodospirillaceae bacterium]